MKQGMYIDRDGRLQETTIEAIAAQREVDDIELESKKRLLDDLLKNLFNDYKKNKKKK